MPLFSPEWLNSIKHVDANLKLTDDIHEDREAIPAIRPSLLFTEEEAERVDWHAVFEQW